VVAAELLLEQPVVAARLLLLAQLQAILALLLAPATVLPRRIGATFDAALVGQAALALEEQLLPFAAALLALRGGVSGHGPRISDAAPLARAAAVVCLRGDVLDAGHVETGGLQRADRRLAAGAGALDEDLDLLQPLLDALARRGVGRDLRGERRRLARALEAGTACGLPGDHVALLVGQRHDRVVERRLDVRLADRDVLLDLAATTRGTSGSGHYFLPAFFLPATCIRRGPLRVRALVFVFWPRTGSPRRWRTPREQPISVRRL